MQTFPQETRVSIDELLAVQVSRDTVVPCDKSNSLIGDKKQILSSDLLWSGNATLRLASGSIICVIS